MIDQITICGIPCSGTKLLNHMVHAALHDWDYTPQERSFRTAKGNAPGLITKLPSDLFSFGEIANNDSIAGLITCRDPLLVLTSKHRSDDYWVSAAEIGNGQPAPIRWYKEIVDWQHSGACIIKYEDLVTEPDLVQLDIGATFDIEWKDRFSDYIHFPMPTKFAHLNVVRPLKPRQLTVEDLPHLGQQLAQCPELIEIREELGYESLRVL